MSLIALFSFYKIEICRFSRDSQNPPKNILYYVLKTKFLQQKHNFDKTKKNVLLPQRNKKSNWGLIEFRVFKQGVKSNTQSIRTPGGNQALKSNRLAGGFKKKLRVGSNRIRQNQLLKKNQTIVIKKRLSYRSFRSVLEKCFFLQS